MADKEKVIYRRALPEDRDSVLAIHEDVYEGADYLPALYNIYMQDPHIHCFLAEIGGKAVSFCAKIMIDGDKAALGGAARTHIQYQGRGLSSCLGAYSSRMILGMYPKLKYLMYANNNAKEAERVLSGMEPGISVVLQMHFLVFHTNWTSLKSLAERGSIEQPIALQPNQIDQFFSDLDIKNIFPQGFLKAYVPWIPFRATDSNLKVIARHTHFIYTVGTDGETEAVSFGHLCPTKRFTLRYDVDFYHWKDRQATPEQKVECYMSHVAAHAKHVTNLTKAGQNIGFYFYIPRDIDVEMVKSLLKPLIGKNIRSRVFQHDSAFVYEKPIVPSSEL